MKYIGLDIGGTSTRVAGMDEAGALFFSHKEATLRDVRTGAELLTKLENLVRLVPGWEQVGGVGIGAPGSIDPEARRVTIAENLRLLEDLPLKDSLEQALGLPVRLENDGRVAALAEALVGGGRGRSKVFYVTVSTGLGGGFVSDGHIYRGSGNMGAYVSRMLLDGRDTCDTLISGTGLIRQAREALGVELSNAGEFFTLPDSPEKAAVLGTYKHNLTIMLMNLAALFNPDIILLGGGVMASRDYFLDDVIRSFRAWAHPLLRDTEIAPAALEEPGVLGACLLAKTMAEDISQNDSSRDKGLS